MQGALTVVAPIVRGKERALSELLLARDRDDKLGLAKTKTIHFARFVVVPGMDASAPCLLAIETNYDGDEDAHLDDLIDVLGAELVDVLAHCDGFANGDRAATKRYLQAKSLVAEAFYLGHQNFTRRRIENDRALRDAIEAALDAVTRDDPSFAKKDASALRDAILARVTRDRPDVSFAPDPTPGFSIPSLLRDLVLGGPRIFATLAALPAILVWLRMKERDDANAVSKEPIRHDDPALDPRMGEIRATEDWLPQNPLTHVAIVKPGIFRMFVLRTALLGVHLLGRYVFRDGSLGDIESIHFARWVILPDRRVLFFSNYDGSWESYLGDFVDKAAKGLSGVWSNTVGFPPTRYLVLDGALDEERFKAWTRAHQVPTHLWFSAYPDRSVRNVWNDRALREAATKPGDEGAREFLEKL